MKHLALVFLSVPLVLGAHSPLIQLKLSPSPKTSLTHATTPYTLDLTHIATNGITWKDVFDMGFRPAAASMTTARTKVDQLAIKNKGKSFFLTDCSISFDIYEGNKLTGIKTFGSQENEEAVVKLDLFREVFSDYSVSEVKLENKEYYENNRPFKTIQISISKGSGLNYVVVYYLRQSAIKEKPFKEMFMVVMLPKERTKKGIRTVASPITPPAGYEHISLDPKVVNKARLETKKPLSTHKQERSLFPFALVSFVLVLVTCIIWFILRIFKNR